MIYYNKKEGINLPRKVKFKHAIGIGWGKFEFSLPRRVA